MTPLGLIIDGKEHILQIGEELVVMRTLYGHEIKGRSESKISTGDEFDEEFWPNVPVKVDKKKAREQYCLKRKTVAKETILAGLPAYQAKERARAQKPDYQAHSPFRWLRDERWTDEPPQGAQANRVDGQTRWRQKWAKEIAAEEAALTAEAKEGA